jgi:hypothetical protein
VLTIVDNSSTFLYTSIALAPDGFARISYYNSINQWLRYAQCTNAACSTSVLNTVDNNSGAGQFSSIAIAPDGFARISYYDSPNGDLKLAQCGSVGCTVGDGIATLDSVGDVGQFSSIAIGSDGYVRISYYDVTNGDLKYYLDKYGAN